jgi:uncharacterized membrane protein YhaH (DUF805 family)
MNWYLEVLRKYAQIDGRSRRKEYWLFTLFHILIAVALIVVDVLLGTFSEVAGLGLFSGLYLLATFLPSLAVSIRRLHDTGRSGWWLFLSFIPLIGSIVLLVFMVLDSEAGANEYGPNPKEPEAAAI